MMERITHAYRQAHQVCPRCSSPDLFTTTAGGIYGPDTNEARCLDCCWFGLVDDLKPMGV